MINCIFVRAVILAFLVCLLTGATWLPLFQPSGIGAPLSLDGTPATANSSGTTTTVTISTTASSGRVVVISLSNNAIGTVSGSTLGAFTRRATINSPTGIDEWTATYSSALTSEVITVTPTPGASFTTVTAFAVTGGVGGFDTNGSLPSTSASGTVSISTTTANTFIYAGYRSSNSNPLAGTGWTQISGGSNFMMVEYQIVSVVQSGTIATTSAVTLNGGIGDAIQ